MIYGIEVEYLTPEDSRSGSSYKNPSFYAPVIEGYKPNPSSSEEKNYLIVGMDGIDPVESEIYSREASVGSYMFGGRVNQRELTLTYGYKPDLSEGESVTKLRRELSRYFPSSGEIEITFYTDDEIVRTVGRVESHKSNIMSNTPLSQIVILCPDPYFESIEPFTRTYKGPHTVGTYRIFHFDSPAYKGEVSQPILYEMVIPGSSYMTTNSLVYVGVGEYNTTQAYDPTHTNRFSTRRGIINEIPPGSETMIIRLDTGVVTPRFEIEHDSGILNLLSYMDYAPNWFKVNYNTDRLWYGVSNISEAREVDVSLTIKQKYESL